MIFSLNERHREQAAWGYTGRTLVEVPGHYPTAAFGLHMVTMPPPNGAQGLTEKDVLGDNRTGCLNMRGARCSPQGPGGTGQPGVPAVPSMPGRSPTLQHNTSSSETWPGTHSDPTALEGAAD